MPPKDYRFELGDEPEERRPAFTRLRLLVGLWLALALVLVALRLRTQPGDPAARAARAVATSPPVLDLAAYDHAIREGAETVIRSPFGQRSPRAAEGEPPSPGEEGAARPPMVVYLGRIQVGGETYAACQVGAEELTVRPGDRLPGGMVVLEATAEALRVELGGRLVTYELGGGSAAELGGP